jgi:hypothetical protein
MLWLTLLGILTGIIDSTNSDKIFNMKTEFCRFIIVFSPGFWCFDNPSREIGNPAGLCQENRALAESIMFFMRSLIQIG